MKKHTLVIISLIVMAGSLSGCFTLADDILPPPGSEVRATPGTVQAATEARYFPLAAPDPAAGQVIYAEKCAPCHGDGGLGNGPKAGELPNPVTPIGLASVARQASPSSWYQIVSQGRIERYMPGFASLSDQERWNVVAYAFTLSTPTDELTLGETVYQGNCAECHGVSGRGNGPRAEALANLPANLTQQARMSELSAADIFNRTIHPPFQDMPSFETAFTEVERWALTAYVRTLTFKVAGVAAAADVPPVAATPPEVVMPSEDAPGGVLGLVSGQVFNASGLDLPGDLEVQLFVFENFREVMSATLVIGSDGSFNYNDTDMKTGRVYLATVDYKGVTFSSDIVMVESSIDMVNMPIQIFDSTTDASGILVDRLHIFMEFIEPDLLRVAQLFIISNMDTRVVIPEGPDTGIIRFSLPQGATNLQFQDGVLGDRYLPTTDGFIDTWSIYPGAGQQQILFSFDLQYDRKVDFSHPLNLPVNSVITMLPDMGIKLKSPQMQESGARQIQDATYLVYNGGNIASGTMLSFNLTGSPRIGGDDDVDISQQNLLLGVGALGAAMIVAGIWLYRQQQVKHEDEIDDDGEVREEVDPVGHMDVDGYMDAIIALDDQYKRGELPEDAYLTRRTELKAQLQELLAK